MFGRKKVAALLAEFIGTGVLTLAILSQQYSRISLEYFIATGAGIALALGTFVFARSSGAHFNPAVTLGLWTARKISTATTVLYMAMQLLGAFGAYHLFLYFANIKSSALGSPGGHYAGRILITEAIATALFAFCYMAALAERYSDAVRSAVTGAGYAIALFIAATAGTLGMLNPAVALGSKAWVWTTYVLGPVIGGIIGVNLYSMVFAEPGEKVRAGVELMPSAVVIKKSAPAATKPAAKTTKRKTTSKKK